jgi:hypothetical protein
MTTYADYAEAEFMEAHRERTEDWGPATESDWHRQWHFETGEKYGCPQDACHPPDEDPNDWDPCETEAGVRCGNHDARRAFHADVADVRQCYRVA